MATYWYVDEAVILGTPIEPFFVGISDATGQFKITSVPANAKLIFRAAAPGWAELDTAALADKALSSKPEHPYRAESGA